MPNFGDDNLIRNVGKAPPALVISQEPGTAAAGNPALQLNQADPNGPALLVKSAGTLIDLQNAAGVSQFRVDGSGNVVSGPSAGFVPSDVGLIAWNYDPLTYAAQTSAVNGTIYMLQFILRQSRTITSGAFAVAVGATTPTASQNYLALVDSAGVIRASTAAGAIDAATASAGWLSQAFTAPYANAPAGKYFLAVLTNAATPLKFNALALQSSAVVEAGIVAAAGFRFAVNGTGATVLPGSFTLSSNTHTNAIAFNVGVS